MPVLYIRIVLDSFYLLIFYSEKFSTWIWRLPFGVNVNLNLSTIFGFTSFTKLPVLHYCTFDFDFQSCPVLVVSNKLDNGWTDFHHASRFHPKTSGIWGQCPCSCYTFHETSVGVSVVLIFPKLIHALSAYCHYGIPFTHQWATT